MANGLHLGGKTKAGLKIALWLIPVVLAVLFFFWGRLFPETAEVRAEVLTCEELTAYTSVQGLEGQFSFEGLEVAHLWRTSLRFLNSGRRTLVGEGQQANIIGDGITFTFPANMMIVDFRLTGDDEAAIRVEATSVNELTFKFSQLRVGESTLVELYLASEQAYQGTVIPTTSGRPIIDGNVVLRDLTTPPPVEQPGFERLPTPLLFVGFVGSGLIAIVVVGFLVSSCVTSCWLHVRLLRWRSQWGDEFAKFVEQIVPPVDEKHRAEFVSKPWRFNWRRWPGFEGQRPPDASSDFGSLQMALFATAACIFLAVAAGTATYEFFVSIP